MKSSVVAVSERSTRLGCSTILPRLCCSDPCCCPHRSVKKKQDLIWHRYNAKRGAVRMRVRALRVPCWPRAIAFGIDSISRRAPLSELPKLTGLHHMLCFRRHT